MQPKRPTRKPALRRSGFTMVELLVVITIIAILMSISFAVYNSSLENARVAATRSLIRQVDGALQDRLDAFARLNLRSQAQQFQLAFNTANAPATIPLPVADVIIYKDRFRAAFPQRVEDLWGLSGDPTIGDNAPLWRVWMRETGATAMAPRPAVITPDIESSVLLHLTLTQGSAFGLPAVSLDGISPNHVRTIETYTDGGGVTHYVSYFVDEWDRPLRFFNWPTRLVRYDGEQSYTNPPPSLINNNIDEATFLASARVLMSRAPQTPTTASTLPYNYFSHPLNQDPDDQFGALTALLNDATQFGGPILRTPTGFSLGSYNAQPIDENFYHTLDTYHTPLIVSGGPDRRIGLFEPNTAGPDRLARPLDITNTDELNDNLTNRQ